MISFASPAYSSSLRATHFAHSTVPSRYRDSPALQSLSTTCITSMLQRVREEFLRVVRQVVVTICEQLYRLAALGPAAPLVCLALGHGEAWRLGANEAYRHTLIGPWRSSSSPLRGMNTTTLVAILAFLDHRFVAPLRMLHALTPSTCEFRAAGRRCALAVDLDRRSVAVVGGRRCALQPIRRMPSQAKHGLLDDPGRRRAGHEDPQHRARFCERDLQREAPRHEQPKAHPVRPSSSSSG